MTTMETAQPVPRPITANKPAGLINILNDHPAPSQLRDSGFYSTAETSSKHNSGASFNLGGLSPTNSNFSPSDKTPSPVPGQNSGMSVASMVSPTTPNSMDHARDERSGSNERTGPSYGASFTENMGPPGGRRESVDSRLINQSMGDMRLNNSPYASHNHSTTSIHNALHNQRVSRAGQEALSAGRKSDVYQPNSDRTPEVKMIRTAPAITGPATSHIARAAEPTKGQAWAFPEEDRHFDDSRRSSIAESLTSSHYTTDSRLPPGQRRLEDGPDFRGGNASAEYLPVHHHTMQHKQLSDLQAMDANESNAVQPYSRTPELRVSHKLAERKRRTEMKELFDQLRDLMPQERGSKASKWEILTKAIAEHQRMSDHVRNIQSHYSTMASENEALRREMQAMRMEMAQLRGEANGSGAHPPSTQQQAPPRTAQSVQPPPPQAYPADRYANSNRTELPPLRAISGIPAGPDSMTGVQYENARPVSYRNERY